MAGMTYDGCCATSNVCHLHEYYDGCCATSNVCHLHEYYEVCIENGSVEFVFNVHISNI
jgi:hypothetical protein